MQKSLPIFFIASIFHKLLLLVSPLKKGIYLTACAPKTPQTEKLDPGSHGNFHHGFSPSDSAGESETNAKRLGFFQQAQQALRPPSSNRKIREMLRNCNKGGPPKRSWMGLPSSKLTWQWKIPMLNRKYISSIRVHFPASYVRLPEGII